MRHYALLSAHMLSAYMLSQTTGLARTRVEQGRIGVEPSLPWVGLLPVDPRSHPNIAESYRRLTSLQDVAVYRLGIESVIDSAARVVQEQAPSSAS